MTFRIKCRSTILPGKFKKIDAERIAADLTKSELNGRIYFVIEVDDTHVSDGWRSE